MLLSLGADAEAADNNGHVPADKAKQLKHDRAPASSEGLGSMDHAQSGSGGSPPDVDMHIYCICTHARGWMPMHTIARRSRGPPACSGFPLRLRGAPSPLGCRREAAAALLCRPRVAGYTASGHTGVLALLVAGGTARDGMTLVAGGATRAVAPHAAESLSQQQHQHQQQHQETLRRADTLRPDAGPRALSPPPLQQSLPDVLLWEEIDSDGKGEEALQALPAVRQPGPSPPHSALTLTLTLAALALALTMSLALALTRSLALALTLSLALTRRCARCATTPMCGCWGRAAPHWAAAWPCDARSMSPTTRCRLGARVAVHSCSTTRRCRARTPRSGGRRMACQHGPAHPSAAPQLGSCASSGCAWRLWAARHSYAEARPLGSQPRPRVLEPAASKVYTCIYAYVHT